MTDTVSSSRRKHRVIIDSRDRNLSLYPFPSKYEIKLDEDIVDVASTTLLVADVPFSAYTIGAANCVVSFTLAADGTDAPPREATLEVGDYTAPADLATALQEALNAAANPEAAFIVTHAPRTDTLSVYATGAFTLRFADVSGRAPAPYAMNASAGKRYAPRSAGRVLGFASDEYQASYDSSAGLDRIVAPFRVNLAADNRYIILYLNGGGNVNTSVNNTAQDSFAILPSTQDRLCVGSQDPVEKSHNPPIAKLARVSVAFVDYDGNPYDFQNQDHRLEIVFHSIRQRKYIRMDEPDE
jgi:hypothetical protein